MKDDTKPGWKTSEMWATGTVAWIIQDVIQRHADNQVIVASGCVAMALVASVYIWSRAAAKRGASDA